MKKTGFDYGVKYISRETGLSGVLAKNIAMELNRQNIDYMSVDWHTVGGDSRDFGNRYDAIWRKLKEMYGITREPNNKYLKKFKEEIPLSHRVGGLQAEMCLERHLKRKKHSIEVDDRLRAKQVFKPTNLKGVAKWMKHPARYDIYGIDFFPKKKR